MFHVGFPCEWHWIAVYSLGIQVPRVLDLQVKKVHFFWVCRDQVCTIDPNVLISITTRCAGPGPAVHISTVLTAYTPRVSQGSFHWFTEMIRDTQKELGDMLEVCSTNVVLGHDCTVLLSPCRHLLFPLFLLKKFWLMHPTETWQVHIYLSSVDALGDVRAVMTHIGLHSYFHTHKVACICAITCKHI